MSPCTADSSASGRSDDRGRRSVRRLRCMYWFVERHVNASLCTGRMSGAYDLLRCPQVELRPVILLIL